MARPNAIADTLRAQCRHAAEVCAKLRQNGSACRRDQFVCFVALAEGNASQNFERRGCWNGKPAVRALNPTPSLLQFGDINGLDSQSLNSNAGAHNIRDRIQSTHLMEMNLLRSRAMNFGLSHRDPLENGRRPLLHERRKLALENQFPNLRVTAGGLVVMRVVVRVVVRVFMRVFMRVFLRVFMRVVVRVVVRVFMRVVVRVVVRGVVRVVVRVVVIAGLHVGRSGVDAKLDPFNFSAFLPLKMHVKVAQIQLGKLPFQSGRLHSKITEGSNGHVATNARKAVKI